MKFSTPLIGALAALATAAPTQSIDETLVPYEAIMGGMSVPNDVYPIFTYENNTATIVFLNSTVLADVKASNAASNTDLSSLSRREAEAGWVGLKIGQPFFKRDAEAEAEAGWVGLKIGQPFFKREAEADAEAGWVGLKIGQPFFKRNAEADAEPGWVGLKIGQPFFKREAEADAEAGWVGLKIGQPFF